MPDANALLARAAEDGLFTHAVCAVARRGSVSLSAFGHAVPDTVFDLASLTKPVATATAVLQLAEAAHLHFDQSALDWFTGDFGPLPHLQSIQIHHLLTHTSGLPPVPHWPFGDTPSHDDCLRAVLSTPPATAPGDAFTYSDTGYILLGEIAARASGLPLDAYFRDHIAAPLALKGTGFCPAPASGLAPTSWDAPPGLVHDPRARALGGVAGHAGLFGTAADLLTYADVLRTNGGPLLCPASVRLMQTTQIPAAIGGQSFGWFCSGSPYLPGDVGLSDAAFAHSGFTGTFLLIDPVLDVCAVLLTNRVLASPGDNHPFLTLRRAWLAAVAAAL